MTIDELDLKKIAARYPWAHWIACDTQGTVGVFEKKPDAASRLGGKPLHANDLAWSQSGSTWRFAELKNTSVTNAWYSSLRPLPRSTHK